MGHVRTGPLPATRKWNHVVGLVAGGAAADQVAAATLDAAEKGLRDAADDTAVVETVWLLVRLLIAARAPDFAAALRGCGVDAGDAPGLLDLTAAFADAVDAATPNGRGRTDLGEMAQAAGVETLHAVVGPKLRNIFGTAPDDLRRELAALATAKWFGHLAAKFFATFAGKCLNYFLSKTLPDHIGAGKRFHTVADRERFVKALDTHCSEASKIVEAMAGDWFSLHRFETAGDIDRERTRRFVAGAMTKLLAELRKREGGRGH